MTYAMSDAAEMLSSLSTGLRNSKKNHFLGNIQRKIRNDVKVLIDFPSIADEE
jgi:hypothetical protein